MFAQAGYSVRVRGGLLIAALCAVSFGAARGAAAADVASDHPAAILVFPKLIVDTSSGLDTVVRISNVSDTEIDVFCFYVNASPQCSLGLENATSCFPNKPVCFAPFGGDIVSGACLPQWVETDFTFQLTKDQPTGWLVSRGEGLGCFFLSGVCSADGTTSCRRDSECPGGRCVLPPCLPLDGTALGRIGPNGQVNEGAIPLSPEDPFIGELKCIAVDQTGKPVARNDLKGEVLIGRREAGPDQTIDVAGYNAIGIPALLDICQPNGTCSRTGTPCNTTANCLGVNNRDNTLVLGGPAAMAEYEGCPNILIVDHYFDGVVDPQIENLCGPDGTCSVSGIDCTNDSECIDNICRDLTCTVTGDACASDDDCANSCGNDNLCTLSGERCLDDEDCTDAIFQTRIISELTLVPCTEDFENQAPDLSRTIAQFLVFNEFEQRFSASLLVECFKEIRLSNIDTPDNIRSLWSAGVGGTLTGQTRIRGVQKDEGTPERPAGFALLGVLEEFRCAGPKYEFPLCNLVEDPELLVSTAAKNLHIQGRRPQADYLYLPGLQ
jgi:hypothetical protein